MKELDIVSISLVGLFPLIQNNHAIRKINQLRKVFTDIRLNQGGWRRNWTFLHVVDSVKMVNQLSKNIFGEDLTVKVGKLDFFESIHVIFGMLAENFQRFDGGNEIDRRTINFEVCCFLFFLVKLLVGVLGMLQRGS